MSNKCTTTVNNSNINEILLLALAKSARVFADSIEAAMVASPPRGHGQMAPGERVTFDPRTEQPPKKADPDGTPEEATMAYVTYLGAISLINKTEHRGANPAEVRKYAMKAGYDDGRGVSGFSNGNTVSRKDGRYLTKDGEKWLAELQKAIDVELPDVVGEPD